MEGRSIRQKHIHRAVFKNQHKYLTVEGGADYDICYSNINSYINILNGMIYNIIYIIYIV